MASHWEDGLTSFRQVDSTPQRCPITWVPPGCRVLPSVLWTDLLTVTGVAGHGTNGLAQLRQVDSTLHKANPKGGVPACLPPDLASLTGSSPIISVRTKAPRKFVPQLLSIVVELVTCCPAFHVPKSTGPIKRPRRAMGP